MQAVFSMSLRSYRPRVRTLADLAPGESAYVVPAALVMLPDRSCRIQTDTPIFIAPDRTATMHVTRAPDGYIADVTICAYQWTARDWADTEPHAPVIRVIFGDEFLQ